MKIVNEIGNGDVASPMAGCVCSTGWKSTRGLWQFDFPHFFRGVNSC